MATIKKNKILAKKSKPIGKYRSGGSPTDPPPTDPVKTDPVKTELTPEEKAEAKAAAAAAATKAEEARIAGMSNKQYRQEKKGVKRNVKLANERAGKNEGKVAKAITTGISAGSGILGLVEGVKRIFKKEQKTGGIIKTKNMTTKATYKEGGSAKPKCPMGMSYDFSLKKCVKPGTTDTPLDKLKKEKARMLKTNFKTGGMVNANAKLVATATAGSKGVKVKVNPKAAASNVAKKPSKPRSKAPKKAAPGRK
jgi:hypothetical protein